MAACVGRSAFYERLVVCAIGLECSGRCSVKGKQFNA